MAIVLKAGNTYSDRYTEGTSDTYYGVIDVCNLNKDQKKALLHLSIYKSSTERTNGKAPVESYSYTVNSDNYNTYFDVAVLETVGVNHFGKAYEYLLSEVRESSTFDENGDEVLGELIWKDWESDET